MLPNSFVHLPDTSEKHERRLWRAGVLSWDEFLERFGECNMHAKRCAVLRTSKEKLKHKDARFFGESLPRKEHWRAFVHFERIAYVDIETTGISADDNELTVIGLYDGVRVHSFIRGKNLEQFRVEIEKYEMIVTFNGSVFDVPFLQKAMPGVKIPKLHSDLRFLLASLGVQGGLKKIEKDFGFEREDDLKGLNGYDAVKMWQAYVKHNDQKALDKLVRYNAADISNLKKLMEWAYAKKRHAAGFVD